MLIPLGFAYGVDTRARYIGSRLYHLNGLGRDVSQGLLTFFCECVPPCVVFIIVDSILGDRCPLLYVNPYSMRVAGAGLTVSLEAEVTGVVVTAEKIACSLVLEGLCSCW